MASHHRPVSGGHTESLGEWLQLHTREIVLGVVAVAVVGGGIFAYRQISAGNEQRAEQALFAAQQAAQSGAPQEGEQALQRVVTGHEGTAAATQAALLLAQLHYSQGEYAEGLATLRQVEGSAGKAFSASVQALIGAGLEGEGKYAEAAAAYRRAVDAAQFEADRESYRTEVARVLTLAGNPAEAAKIWAELANDPTSPHAPEARVRLGELEAKPAARG
ncbi:MAG TPA: tetratricopeptide repeat protein [Gemmatimonadales bacterium]